jgi:hypothetical protein
MLIRVALRWFLTALRLSLGLLLCYRGIRAHTNTVWEGTVSATGIDIMCIQARRQQAQTAVPMPRRRKLEHLRLRITSSHHATCEEQEPGAYVLGKDVCDSQRQNQPRAHARARDQEFTLCVLRVYRFIPRTHRITPRRTFPVRPSLYPLWQYQITRRTATKSHLHRTQS